MPSVENVNRAVQPGPCQKVVDCGLACVNKIIELVKAFFWALHQVYYYLRYGKEGGYAKFQAMADEYHWQPLKANKKLNEVTMLASHNGLIAKEDGWLYSQQNWTLQKQLNAGVRVIEFDMQLHKKTLTVCHNPPKSGYIPDLTKVGPYATFEEKLDEVVDWMKENEDEIVVINLDIARDKKLKPEHLNKVLGKHKNMIFTEKDFKRNGGWPTIGQMRKSGKRLAFINFKDEKSKYTLSRYDYLISSIPTTSTRHTGEKLLMNESGDKQTEKNKLYMVQHNAMFSNQLYAIFYAIFHTPCEWLGILEKTKPGKLLLSDNKVSTIEKVLKTKPLGNNRTNFIMMDHVHQFLLDGGLKLINQMNS